ncbi:MAG: hypothetical protein J6U92_04340 [Clostridia bacterium]|nr:hypothetical protein [Clostridia bacterium]
MVYEKIFVRVAVEFSKSGGIIPLKFWWKDGREIYIDKIIIRESAPCRSAGILMQRFTVKILGLERFIYYDKEKEIWFVERLI